MDTQKQIWRKSWKNAEKVERKQENETVDGDADATPEYTID